MYVYILVPFSLSLSLSQLPLQQAEAEAEAETAGKFINKKKEKKKNECNETFFPCSHHATHSAWTERKRGERK